MVKASLTKVVADCTSVAGCSTALHVRSDQVVVRSKGIAVRPRYPLVTLCA